MYLKGDHGMSYETVVAVNQEEARIQNVAEEREQARGQRVKETEEKAQAQKEKRNRKEGNAAIDDEGNETKTPFD